MSEDEELSPDQKRIADKIGVSHEAYAARCIKGVCVAGSRYDPAPKYFHVRLRWFGLPPLRCEQPALSMLRIDRRAYPKVVYLSEEDRHVIPGGVPVVEEGSSCEFRTDAEYSDVSRIELGLWRWHGVAALYAVRRPCRFPRFGLDLVSQLGRGQWRDLVIRFYRP